jgi:hypothetical protein
MRVWDLRIINNILMGSPQTSAKGTPEKRPGVPGAASGRGTAAGGGGAGVVGANGSKDLTRGAAARMACLFCFKFQPLQGQIFSILEHGQLCTDVAPNTRDSVAAVPVAAGGAGSGKHGAALTGTNGNAVQLGRISESEEEARDAAGDAASNPFDLGKSAFETRQTSSVPEQQKAADKPPAARQTKSASAAEQCAVQRQTTLFLGLGSTNVFSFVLDMNVLMKAKTKSNTIKFFTLNCGTQKSNLRKEKRASKTKGGLEWYIKLFLGVHFADNLAWGHRGISGVKWKGPKVLEESP